MADSQRSSDEFLNVATGLYKDNTSGDISPQDLRDLVESMRMSCGSIYVTTPAATTINTAGVYEKAAGTTAQNPDAGILRFDTPVSNRLRYTGGPNIHAAVRAAVTMTAASSNVEVGLAIAKNGTVLTPSIIERKIGTGSDKGAVAVQADVDMSTNDYLELYVTNLDGTGSVTINLANLFALGHFV